MAPCRFTPKCLIVPIIGYEISFNKYFYQHKALRPLEDITADMLALEKESDGLIAEILGFGQTPF